jgi:hypothetical protein
MSCDASAVQVEALLHTVSSSHSWCVWSSNPCAAALYRIMQQGYAAERLWFNSHNVTSRNRLSETLCCQAPRYAAAHPSRIVALSPVTYRSA